MLVVRFFCNASRAHFPPVWHPLLFGRSPRTLHFLHSKINVCGAGYLFLTRMDAMVVRRRFFSLPLTKWN